MQLSALARGVHVVVGTPGRIMDHLEKGTLDLSKLRFLVLDEADEMLNICLLYTSDAADERSSVDLGGRRIIKKKKTQRKKQKENREKQ